MLGKRVDPTDPANLAKMPRWARWEIERLTRLLASAEAKLAEGPEDSDTFADPYSDAKRPLGQGTTIEFVLGQDRFDRDMRINVCTEQRRDGTVVLDVSGDNGIVVLPRASNSVGIAYRGD